MRLMKWVLLHLVPIAIVIVCMNALSSMTGISAAAVVAAVAIVIVTGWGESEIAAEYLEASRQRFRLFTITGLTLGLVAGLIVMSAVDLAGYDMLASYSGMIAAGVVIAASQAIAITTRRIRWTVAVLAGWIVGAMIFRIAAAHAATWTVFGGKPLATVYLAGHNELLWACIGLAVQGFSTASVLLTEHAPIMNGELS